MSQKYRLEFTLPEGPHQNHSLIAKRYDRSMCGKLVRTTVIRCRTCQQFGLRNPLVAIEQEEVKHG